MAKFGLGYDTLRAVHPGRHLRVGVGVRRRATRPTATGPRTRRSSRPCRASTSTRGRPDEPPAANPVGALGDISAALFAAIGVLAALRYRDRTGEGQHVDVAMFDATVAMTDIVMNLASLGPGAQPYPPPFILDTFRAADGWFVMQLVREHQFDAPGRGRRSPGVARRSASRRPRRAGARTSTTSSGPASKRGPRPGASSTPRAS